MESLWVDVDESTGKLASIKEFKNGSWVDVLSSSSVTLWSDYSKYSQTEWFKHAVVDVDYNKNLIKYITDVLNSLTIEEATALFSHKDFIVAEDVFPTECDTLSKRLKYLASFDMSDEYKSMKGSEGVLCYKTPMGNMYLLQCDFGSFVSNIVHFTFCLGVMYTENNWLPGMILVNHEFTINDNGSFTILNQDMLNVIVDQTPQDFDYNKIDLVSIDLAHIIGNVDDDNTRDDLIWIIRREMESFDAEYTKNSICNLYEQQHN